MIQAGDTIVNPVTGERMHFRKTSRETNGELVEIELALQPDGFVAAAHVHPYQTERFEILAGTVEFRLGKKRIVAEAGDVVVVEPGTPHKFRNAGTDEARFVTEVRPALQFEQLLETMFGLAADGKTNKKGMPNPLRLAVIAKAHFDDVRRPEERGDDREQGRTDAQHAGEERLPLWRRGRHGGHRPDDEENGRVEKRDRAQPAGCVGGHVDRQRGAPAAGLGCARGPASGARAEGAADPHRLTRLHRWMLIVAQFAPASASQTSSEVSAARCTTRSGRTWSTAALTACRERTSSQDSGGPARPHGRGSVRSMSVGMTS